MLGLAVVENLVDFQRQSELVVHVIIAEPRVRSARHIGMEHLHGFGTAGVHTGHL